MRDRELAFLSRHFGVVWARSWKGRTQGKEQRREERIGDTKSHPVSQGQTLTGRHKLRNHELYI